MSVQPQKQKSIKLNAILNGSRTVLNLLFPLITFPYISRVLQVNEIGKYNFSDSVVSYFSLIAALGFSQYAIREGTQYRTSRTEISCFASRVFSLNIVSTIISYVLLLTFLLYSKKIQSYYLCVLILSTQIFFTTIGVEWIYSIFEEYAYITIRSIAFKVLSIILLFVLVRHQGDYLKYAAITIISSVGANVLNYFHAHKFCDLHFTMHFNWSVILIPVLTIFGSNVAMQIYVNSDITMLGYLCSNRAVGIYSVSTKIYTIIKNVLTAVLTVTIPRFSLFAAQNASEKYKVLLQRVTNTLIVLAVPAIVGLIFLSRNIVYIIAGPQYFTSQKSLRILSLAIFFSVFNGLFGQCILIPFKKEKVFLIGTIVSAAFNIGLNFILLPFLAERGAALTTLLSEFILCIILYVGSRHYVSEVFKSKSSVINLSSVLVASLGICCICFVVRKYISGFILQTAVSVIGSAIIYSVLLLLLRNEVMIDFFSGARSRFHK